MMVQRHPEFRHLKGTALFGHHGEVFGQSSVCRLATGQIARLAQPCESTAEQLLSRYPAQLAWCCVLQSFVISPT